MLWLLNLVFNLLEKKFSLVVSIYELFISYKLICLNRCLKE